MIPGLVDVLEGAIDQRLGLATTTGPTIHGLALGQQQERRLLRRPVLEMEEPSPTWL